MVNSREYGGASAIALPLIFPKGSAMITPSQRPRFHWLREMVVPAIMLVAIAAYTYASVGLSSTALIFPSVLIVVILAALICLVGAEFFSTNSGSVRGADEEGAILDKRPWFLMALPLLLFLGFEFLGAFIALFATVYGAQLIFSTQTPFKSLLVSIAVTTPVYLLFKYFLYVRFPLGMLGIG